MTIKELLKAQLIAEEYAGESIWHHDQFQLTNYDTTAFFNWLKKEKAIEYKILTNSLFTELANEGVSYEMFENDILTNSIPGELAEIAYYPEYFSVDDYCDDVDSLLESYKEYEEVFLESGDYEGSDSLKKIMPNYIPAILLFEYLFNLDEARCEAFHNELFRQLVEYYGYEEE